MATPTTVSQEDLQRVHRKLCVTTPLDQASPLLLTTLTVIARCWLQKQERRAPLAPGRTVLPANHRAARAMPADEQPNTDFKRRAAADFD